MDRIELFRFYEKLYFHEIDMRDKLNGRVPVLLFVLVALIGFLGYMLKSTAVAGPSLAMIAFWPLYLVSVVFTGASILFLVRSWHGSAYLFLPSAAATEQYRLELEQTYQAYEQCDQLVQEHMMSYLYTYFVNLSSANAESNEVKSANLHRAGQYMVYAAVFAFIAFIPFHFGRLGGYSQSAGANSRAVQQVAGSNEPLLLGIPQESLGAAMSAESRHRLVDTTQQSRFDSTSTKRE